ncbi:MAG: sulfite exporter TauE/SafE family protein [Clostridia bacterium]|nr:sulfite exporter TauE/SafE family protein [Clostridia bacterium]
MNLIKKLLAGMLIGSVNIILGAGGGMLTVPLYKKMGMEQKNAQINTVATILPITFISSIIYLINGNVNFSNAYIYLIPGLLGSIIGTFAIKKVSNKLLTLIFALLMIWAGVRLFIK